MSYLLDLVRSFDENELKQFRLLDLKGNEELIRDYYAANAQSKKFDEIALPAKFSLTQSHFDKTTSILLDKAISKLYGDDYNHVLIVIHNKALSTLAVHELKITERRILKKNNKKEAAAFYKVAFDFCRRMYHPDYNSKLTHSYGAKYLQALGNTKTIAEESLVANLTFHADTIAEMHSGNEVKYKAVAEKHVKTWQQKLAGSKNKVAWFYASFAQASYYKFLTEDAEGYTAAIEKAYAAYRDSTDKIPVLFKGTLLCELAFGYLSCNRFKDAQPYYALAIKEFPETVGKNTYHIGNYVLVCIMNKDFATATKVFNETLLPKTNSNINRSVMFDIYTAACYLNLHQQKCDEAFRYISIMANYRKNEITLTGHIIIRMFQTLYFAMSGDYATADSMVKKNLRFIRRQFEGPSLAYYEGYMDALGKIIKYKTGAAVDTQALRQQIANLQSGMYMLFNSLLYHMLD